jgi:recombination protein RecR
MSFGPVIDDLINALRVLPGVGQKSAQRMALSLLDGDRAGSKKLVRALDDANELIGRCQSCQTLSEKEQCVVCSNPSRDSSILCIVESPSDLLAIEHMHHFSGVYFVLSGSLSPLEGRGPNEVGIPQLIARVKALAVEEIILATNPTIEGEATAHYIAEVFAQAEILITRLAHGIPLGGTLGYVDGGTLSHAFSGRMPVVINE